MSIVKVDEALALVLGKDNLYLSGPQTEELIFEVEDRLGVTLSEDYRYFLKECGSLSFGSFEVFGIVQQGLEAEFEANFLRSTMSNRNYGGPENVYVIGHNELGSPSMRSGEAGVMAYYQGAPESAQTYELLAPSFGDFLFDGIVQELEWMCED